MGIAGIRVIHAVAVSEGLPNMSGRSRCLLTPVTPSIGTAISAGTRSSRFNQTVICPCDFPISFASFAWFPAISIASFKDSSSVFMGLKLNKTWLLYTPFVLLVKTFVVSHKTIVVLELGYEILR